MGEDAKTEDPIPKSQEEQRPELPPAGEDKKDAVVAAAAAAGVAITLKLNLHCEGCAKKLKRSIRKNFEGVEEVMTDLENNKLTVKGKVDPANLLKKLEEKTHRKIELLSPLPTSAAAAGDDKKADIDKSEKKPEPDKEDEKPKEIVVVLKIRLHCEGCMHKIKRVIKKYDGVNSVNFEATKNLVKIVGVMDVNSLVSYLRDKLKRSVDVIPIKEDKKIEKEEESVEKDTKNKEISDEKTKVSGEEKEKENKEEKPVEIEEAKVEVNKMEYYGQTNNNSYYTIPPSMPINHVYMNHGYYGYGDGYGVPPSDQSHGYNSNRVFVDYPRQGYHNEVYNLQQYPHSPGPYGAFSDENPNASCYVM